MYPFGLIPDAVLVPVDGDFAGRMDQRDEHDGGWGWHSPSLPFALHRHFGNCPEGWRLEVGVPTLPASLKRWLRRASAGTRSLVVVMAQALLYLLPGSNPVHAWQTSGCNHHESLLAVISASAEC